MIKDTNTRVQLTISKKILAEIEFMADEMGISRGDLMRVALKFYLDYHEALKSSAKISEVLDKLDKIKTEKEGTQ